MKKSYSFYLRNKEYYRLHYVGYSSTKGKHIYSATNVFIRCADLPKRFTFELKKYLF